MSIPSGVKQLKAWFFSQNSPLNTRGATVDFQDGGEPNQQVFGNLFQTTITKKIDANNFQDQSDYNDINNRTTLDKFTTPNNLPVVAQTSGNPIAVTAVVATNENTGGSPYVTYEVTASAATYSDIEAGTSTTILTPANYPTVTADPASGNVAVITPVQNGESVDYQVKVIGNTLPSAVLIIDTTYSNLATLKASNQLQQGYWYRLVYQCIHQIPYTNVLNTSSALSIPTETLLVQAISTSKLDYTQVRSEDHPQDIIHWRLEDNQVITPTTEIPLLTTAVTMDTVNGGFTSGSTITAVSPPVSRAGRIYYREDTIQRISTPYDFRGVVLRRWALDRDGSNNLIFNNALSFTATTAYNHHDIILYSGIYYLVIYPFTSTSTFSDTISNVTSLGDMFNSTPNYVGTNPTSHVFAGTDTQYFTSSKIEVSTNSSDYVDSFTFYNYQGTLQAFNVHIKDYISAWIEAVTWEFYPNIVFASTVSAPVTNVNIDTFSYDLTIYNGTSIDIGSFCRDIYINGRLTANVGNITIGSDNQYLHIDKFLMGSGDTTVNRLVTNIGTGNRSMILIGGSYNIKDNNNRFVSNLTTSGILGSKNYVTNFLSGSYEVEDYNSFISLVNCVTNSVGNRNRNIFSVSGTNTSFGNYNTGITSLKNSSIEGVSIPHSNIIVKNSCSNIIISGTSNVYDSVNTLTLKNDTSISNSTFKNVSNLNITNTGGATTLANCNFENVTTIGIDACNCSFFVIRDVQTISAFSSTISDSNVWSSVLINMTNFNVSQLNTVNSNTVNLSNNTASSSSNLSIENCSSFTINYVGTLNIQYFSCINSNDINIYNLASGDAASITNMKIDTCSTVSISNINNILENFTIINTSSFTAKYLVLNGVSINNSYNFNILSALSDTLSLTNVLFGASNANFNGVQSSGFVAVTNTGSAASYYKMSITDCNFNNIDTVTLNAIALTSQNSMIRSCSFEQIYNTVFGSVPTSAAATQPFNYVYSSFKNINGSFAQVSIATPFINYSTISNLIIASAPATGFNPGITYRNRINNSNFNGNVIIKDTVVTPDYSKFTLIDNFEGKPILIKTTDSNITISEYSFARNINFTTKGVDIDNAPSNAHDILYTVIDSTKVYGLQQVISGGNVVPTSTSLTLV